MPNDGGCRADTRCSKLVVRARRAEDLFFAGFVDHDECDARRRFWIAIDMAGIDVFGTQECLQFIAPGVATETRDERDARAKTRGGDGLVGAFATAGGEEMVAIHGFARFGESLAAHKVIGIGAADHDNVVFDPADSDFILTEHGLVVVFVSIK